MTPPNFKRHYYDFTGAPESLNGFWNFQLDWIVAKIRPHEYPPFVVITMVESPHHIGLSGEDHIFQMRSQALFRLPGFDGLKALYVFLPDEWCWTLQRSERYFLIVLAMAAFFRVLDWALYPGLQLGRWLCAFAGVPMPAL